MNEIIQLVILVALAIGAGVSVNMGNYGLAVFFAILAVAGN